MSRIRQLERQALAGIANHDASVLRNALLGGLRNTHTIYRGPPAFESYSLLDFCISNNYTQGVQMLLSGPYINTMTALDTACCRRNDDIIRVILNKSLAIRRGCSECLFTLLRNGLNLMANTYVRDPRFVINDQQLMVSGTYLKAFQGRAGQSPLHVTCFISSPFTMECLLSYGALKDIQDDKGCTPLYVSCCHGNYMTTLSLVRHGASTAYTNSANYPIQQPNSPLYALCHISNTSNRNEAIINMMSDSIDFTKEIWLNAPSIHTQTKYISDDAYAKLRRLQRTPSNIFALSMRAVRGQLNQGVNGRSIFNQYDQLGPQVAKGLVAKLKMNIWST